MLLLVKDSLSLQMERVNIKLRSSTEQTSRRHSHILPKLFTVCFGVKIFPRVLLGSFHSTVLCQTLATYVLVLIRFHAVSKCWWEATSFVSSLNGAWAFWLLTVEFCFGRWPSTSCIYHKLLFQSTAFPLPLLPLDWAHQLIQNFAVNW